MIHERLLLPGEYSSEPIINFVVKQQALFKGLHNENCYLISGWSVLRDGWRRSMNPIHSADKLLTSFGSWQYVLKHCWRCCCLFPRVTLNLGDILCVWWRLLPWPLTHLNAALGPILPALCQYQSLFVLIPQSITVNREGWHGHFVVTHPLVWDWTVISTDWFAQSFRWKPGTWAC